MHSSKHIQKFKTFILQTGSKGDFQTFFFSNSNFGKTIGAKKTAPLETWQKVSFSFQSINSLLLYIQTTEPKKAISTKTSLLIISVGLEKILKCLRK